MGKKCRGCQIDYSKLMSYRFPKDVPVSESMRRTVNCLLEAAKKDGKKAPKYK